MNNQINKKSIFTAIAFIVFMNTIVVGQTINPTNDSLSLKSVIQQVISSYPTVRIAEEAIKNADSKIGLAKTGYNPVIQLFSTG